MLSYESIPVKIAYKQPKPAHVKITADEQLMPYLDWISFTIRRWVYYIIIIIQVSLGF